MRDGLPFDVLLDMAERERDACARVASDMDVGLRRAQDRMRLLESHFAACSSARPKDAAAHDGAKIRNDRAFLARLEMALRRQADDVRGSQARLDQARDAMREAEKRLRAFGQLKTRALRAAAAVEAKRDQQMNDEFAARRVRAAL
ncbi:flagellar export protein FliJ [Betaproteobacteria bacterium GR16-43]|nr:flagellar export protein FliJ [Betaproteobacteria bacterium GR16-43]